MNTKENPIEKKIIATYVELSKEKPIEKIRVSELCSRCGIQRQTFYNHYNDLDGLVESIFSHEGSKILKYSTTANSWENGLYDILVTLKKNKEFVNAVYQGIPREQLENRLYLKIENLLKNIVDEISAGSPLTDAEKNYIVQYHKYAFCGLVLDWVRFGMKTDPRELVYNINIVIDGSIHEAVDRYKELHKKKRGKLRWTKEKVSI
jgi:AcrR family transcriptional regulator